MPFEQLERTGRAAMLIARIAELLWAEIAVYYGCSHVSLAIKNPFFSVLSFDGHGAKTADLTKFWDKLIKGIDELDGTALLLTLRIITKDDDDGRWLGRAWEEVAGLLRAIGAEPVLFDGGNKMYVRINLVHNSSS